MRPLASRLRDSGVAFVASALAAYGEGRPAVFLLHAGAAVEHLLKAGLTELNPLLIAERRAPDIKRATKSLLWLADEANHKAQIPSTTKTLSPMDCLTLAIASGLVAESHHGAVDNLVSARNGVAHVGSGDLALADEVLPGFLGVTLAIGERLALDAQGVFGVYADFAAEQLDAHKQELERRYAGLVALATVRFTEQYGTADRQHLDDLRRMIEVRLTMKGRDDQIVDCPVCCFPVVVQGDLEIGRFETEYDRDGFPEGQYAIIDFYPWEYSCPVCGLHLDDPELIRLSGMFADWEASDEEHSRLMDAYEDDLRAEHQWDEYRGR